MIKNLVNKHHIIKLQHSLEKQHRLEKQQANQNKILFITLFTSKKRLIKIYLKT